MQLEHTKEPHARPSARNQSAARVVSERRRCSVRAVPERPETFARAERHFATLLLTHHCSEQGERTLPQPGTAPRSSGSLSALDEPR
jgi:hypothetical protein